MLNSGRKYFYFLVTDFLECVSEHVGSKVWLAPINGKPYSGGHAIRRRINSFAFFAKYDGATRCQSLATLLPGNWFGASDRFRKKGDPIRPEYVPSVADDKREGILAWSIQLTDDKHMAIIHMVAANHHAFDTLLNDKRPEIQVFEIGKQSQTLIETTLKLVKKDFDLNKFQVVAR